MTSLFRSVMDFIYGFIGNYGWAVIVFSMLIKLVLLPLDIKSRKSMRAMAALNPKMEELKKRYGKDQEKLNQKMNELYKKNKVNPLSGCLPLLIQLPILYIMFAVMRNVAAELQLKQMYEWIAQNMCDESGAFLSLDSASIQNFLESIRNGGAMDAFSGQNWLWIKNVFQPDTFSKTVIPTVSELTSMINQYSNALSEEGMALLKSYVDNTALAEAVDAAVKASCGYQKYTLFMGLTSVNFPSNWSTYVNGVCALPILAAGTQFLTTLLQPASEQPATATADGQKGGTGAFMKWFFPILSLWICWTSTAAFAIYWVFVNVWSMFTTFCINKYLNMKEKPNIETPTKEELIP